MALALWVKEGILLDYWRGAAGWGWEWEWSGYIALAFTAARGGRGVTVDLKGDSRDESVYGGGLPQRLCTYGWIMTHFLQRLPPFLLTTTTKLPCYSPFLPLLELSSRNIHLYTLFSQNQLSQLLSTVEGSAGVESMKKKICSVVGLISPPSRGPPELPVCCMCSAICIRKNLQADFQ